MTPLIQLVGLFLFTSGVFANEPVDGGDKNSFPYLYATRSNHSASAPVIDYIAPGGNDDRPLFLYDKHQPHRIVEFYGHWCNTCKNFKPHFVHFAKIAQKLAQRHNETVHIYAVSCHPNRKLCRKQTAKGYPLIRLIKAGHTEGLDMKHTEINPVRALEKLGMHLDVKEEDGDWDLSPPNEGGSSMEDAMQSVLGALTHEPKFLKRSRDDLKSDIHRSFDYFMRNSVFTSDEPVDSERADVLREWLKLLVKTLPVAWDLHKLLKSLLKDFNYITKHEHYLYGVLDQHAAPKEQWSYSCSRGDPDAGFTCGLWELFHSMTVGVVDFNSLVHEKKRISTDKAANTLRQFLLHFFQCVECRDNFLKMYDNCEFGRCTRLNTDTSGLVKDKITSWAQLSLWLFEVHNDVNVRLMREKASREGRRVSREDELEMLWPPPNDCLPCWHETPGSGLPTPNPTVIYKWLQLEYGQRDENSGKIYKEVRLLHDAAQRKQKRVKTTAKVTQSSAAVGFVFVFYVAGRIRKRRIIGLHKKFDGKTETGESTRSDLRS